MPVVSQRQPPILVVRVHCPSILVHLPAYHLLADPVAAFFFTVTDQLKLMLSKRYMGWLVHRSNTLYEYMRHAVFYVRR